MGIARNAPLPSPSTNIARVKPVPVPGTALYWTAFALILCTGAALRAFWTYRLGLPLLTPDSESYIGPVVDHPLWPFSEMRTAGVPAFLVLAVGVAGAPAGILIAQNLLAVVSCAAVSVALRRYLGLSVASLVVLVFLLFSAKELSFEYAVLTEHVSTMLYLLYAAAVLASWRTPQLCGLGVTLGLLVLINVLVKPSAVVLTVSTLVMYGFHAWREPRHRIGIARACSIFAAVFAAGLSLYVAAFHARYGDYSISHFEGFNQFSHVGQLMAFDGANHADIKKDLRPLITLYREKYASRGKYQPDWLIYGTTTPELKRDFGDVSPLSVVMAHLDSVPPAMRWRAANRIFGDLAVEGMRAYPGEYLSYAGYIFLKLLWDGYTFSFFRYMPSGDYLDPRKPDVSPWNTHDDNVNQWRRILFGHMGVPVPKSCDEARGLRARASWPMRAFLDSAILCPNISRADSRDIWVKRVDYAYGLVAKPLRIIFMWLPLFAAAGLAAMAQQRVWRGNHGDALAAGLFFALCCFGYLLLLSLISAAEPVRFLANVQGLMIISMVVLTAGGLQSIRTSLSDRVVSNISRACRFGFERHTN